jgi:hypothetical protein
MKKVFLSVFFLFNAICFFSRVHAQEKHTIAIFAPLYLDSAFNEFNDYRYAKNVFPKFINPGLEFYEGAQLALDSLAIEGANLEVFLYDTRSGQSIHQLLGRPELSSLDLIIAHCSGSEVKTFADYGLEKSIPVINTTMPHDGGAKANPYLVVLNPTLKTQVEGVYKFVQKYYSINPVIVFRKKGTNEDQIKSYLDDYTKSTLGVPLRLRYVDLPDGFTPGLLKTYLDTVRKTAIIAGSLDPAFGRQLATHLASINDKHQTILIGMPTWDGSRDFAKPELKGLEIIYSNPFYNSRADRVSESLVTHFSERLYARPSDMVFRGFQSTYKYGKLLQKYGSDLSSNLGNKLGNIFFDLDVQPVLNRENMNLEYFENKRLYFLKWQDSEIKSVVSL